MSDVVKSDLDVSLDWLEQLADADALEQRATELEQLARQIRTTALRARVRIRRAKCEELARKVLDDAGVVTCPTFDRDVGKSVSLAPPDAFATDVGKRGSLGKSFVHPAGVTLPNDGPEGSVGGREVSRPAAEFPTCGTSVGLAGYVDLVSRKVRRDG